MTWIRMGVFVALTLVATTLPASGRVAPVQQVAPAAAPTQDPPTSPAGVPADTSAPAQGEPGSPARSKPVQSDPGLLIQAAPQMDVWKSAPTRPMGSSGPQMVAAIASLPTASWQLSATPGQDLQTHATRVHEHAREWLVDRYPNAPPRLG